MKSSIYCFTNLINNKKYIGSSAISKICRGVRNKCGSFKWKYIDNL